MKTISIFLITLALIAGMGGCGDNGYTPSQNLEIYDWYDLDAVRDNLDGDYTMMNDLDSTTIGYEELASPTADEGKGWQPIGTYDDSYEPFTGTFDGQGYEIKDIFIDRPNGEDYAGLFGVVNEGGIIKNVGVVNADVTGYWAVGGLAVINSGIVTNSYYTGSLSGTWVGGLVGWNEGGTVSNCHSTGSVTGYETVGGLVGLNDGTVSDSYSTGNVTGGHEVGGLVGWNEGGTVSNCHSTGSVTGYEYVGGLVGVNYDTVSDSYSTGNVTGGHEVGGLVGWNEGGTVSNCHSTGNVAGNSSVGGLVGVNGGTVNESHSSADVTGSSLDVGGLVGYNDNSGTVSRSHSTGSVGGDHQVGGLAGCNGGNITSSYSLGNVTGKWGVGGVVGYNGGTVDKSYANSNVTVDDSCGGGLVGYHWQGTVSDSYATGTVIRSSGIVASFGGFVGYNEQGKIINCYSTGSVHYQGHSDPTDKGFAGGVHTGGDYEMTGNFWNTQTSGQTSTAGNATGKTTAEMQDITTFSGAGWNITEVANSGTRNSSYTWNIVVDDETYPFLSWQPIL